MNKTNQFNSHKSTDGMIDKPRAQDFLFPPRQAIKVG